MQTLYLGVICQGSTAGDGKLTCSVQVQEPGSIQLVATASDAQGNASRAESTIWVTGGGDLWFGGENDDRIDIIPARKNWKPGETAQFQVRMPFRHVTALVAVERGGVRDWKVVVEGKTLSLRCDLGGCRLNKKTIVTI